MFNGKITIFNIAMLVYQRVFVFERLSLEHEANIGKHDASSMPTLSRKDSGTDKGTGLTRRSFVRRASWVAIWVCLKMGYTPNYSHLIGIMIINHWV